MFSNHVCIVKQITEFKILALVLSFCIEIFKFPTMFNNFVLKVLRLLARNTNNDSLYL